MALGTWQVQRLHWKESIIADLASANAKDPITKLPTEKTELDALQFRKVSLSGTWLGDTEFHLAPRYWRDQFGYTIVTPFKLNDGRTLLVNRGWVPAAKKEPATRPETRVKGYAAINGLIRTDSDRSYFSPPNQPEKNLWFGRDISVMGSYAKLPNVVPVMVDLVGMQDANKLPVPSDGTIRVRNDHLSYIITWYGIALGILVIFVLYHRKKA
jgi:surfeit locus 1 family protein